MRSPRQYAPIFSAVLLLSAAAAQAARVDMSDPRRAVGREDDIRVDAQITQETVSNGSPITVTYQVENLTPGWIAIADKICSTDFDRDSRIITVSVGAEVPTDSTLPHLVAIGPGMKKTFLASAVARVAATGIRSPLAAVPRFVQVKLSVLRDVTQFKELIARQDAAAGAPVQIRLTDSQFDAWLQANDSILLNTIPVVWQAGGRSTGIDADHASPRNDQMTLSGSNW